MDKYITDIVQVYLSIFYFLIPLSDKPNSLMVRSSKVKNKQQTTCICTLFRKYFSNT